MTQRYDVAVVGVGLVGSAALRHLTLLGARAIGVGPAEPANWDHHDGVFASHYDSGRITRQIDRQREWADLAIRSISQYQQLTELTGIDFHHPVGTLWADEDHDRVHEIGRISTMLDIECQVDETSCPVTVHGYRLPGGAAYAYEPAPAGYVDPRRMLAAQLEAATSAGAVVCNDHVVARERTPGAKRLRTASGQTIDAKRILLATGAYANAYELTPAPLPVRVKSEITMLAHVAEDTARAWSKLPTLIYGLRHETLSDFYLVPPTRYPNGRFYLKAGADTARDLTMTTRAEMNAWMRAGRSDDSSSAFEEVMRAILPSLRIEETLTKRCLITYTAHGLPYIDEIDANVFVAVGGNGRGAKSSDAIGRAAAALSLGNWDDPLPRESFRVPSDAADQPDAIPL